MSDTMILIIAIVVVAAVLIYFYNRLVVARMRTKEAWSTIDTHLKRRYDLIPNLVETVKGYAAHESETLEKVVQARNMAMNTNQDVAKQGESENMLTGALKSIFALSESYPDLKANQNFSQLQTELTETEDRIQATRQFYNSVVLSYNTITETFPSNLFAKIFAFKPVAFFELDEAEKVAVQKPVAVQF